MIYFNLFIVLKMIYQVGKKQCLNSGRKRNDIDPWKVILLSNPPPLWNFLGLCVPKARGGPGVGKCLNSGPCKIC